MSLRPENNPYMGGPLKFASVRLRDNYDIVHAAVKTNGWAIQHASPRLRCNHQLQRVALTRVALNGQETAKQTMVRFLCMLNGLDSTFLTRHKSSSRTS